MSKTRTIIKVLTIAASLACAGGCAQTVAMQTSPAIPAAEGKIKVKKGDNGNTALSLKVEHLAEPRDVAPGATTYVVWIQGPGTVQNVGALQVGNAKEASLETVTALEDFTVFVTAEPVATAAVPTGERYLIATVDQ
jgi:hypothetical protein